MALGVPKKCYTCPHWSWHLLVPPLNTRQLIPMISFIGLGMGSAALYLLRLALRSPDVCWDRKNNPEPWNRLSPTDQYKFLAVSTDYKKLKKDRPDF
nr:NADH dehydrogenase [ubiquinone] 1 alpha subcomplex subunit 4-like 2 isoform X2 [Microcebus murinus]